MAVTCLGKVRCGQNSIDGLPYPQINKQTKTKFLLTTKKKKKFGVTDSLSDKGNGKL